MRKWYDVSSSVPCGEKIERKGRRAEGNPGKFKRK